MENKVEQGNSTKDYLHELPDILKLKAWQVSISLELLRQRD